MMEVSKRWAAVSTAVALLTCATVAEAATVNAHDVKTVVAALQENGYRAKLNKGEDGDPLIITGSGGNNIVLVFSSCTNHENCDYIEFLSYYADISPRNGSEIVNKWHSEENFASVLYIEREKQLSLYHYIITGTGGISSESLTDTMSYFVKDLASLGALVATK
jgi:hypothetical protein